MWRWPTTSSWRSAWVSGDVLAVWDVEGLGLRAMPKRPCVSVQVRAVASNTHNPPLHPTSTCSPLTVCLLVCLHLFCLRPLSLRLLRLYLLCLRLCLLRLLLQCAVRTTCTRCGCCRCSGTSLTRTLMCSTLQVGARVLCVCVCDSWVFLQGWSPPLESRLHPA